jgi:hypothetical protein
MISKVRVQRIATSFLIAAGFAQYAPPPFAAAQTAGAPAAQAASASPLALDFEFFKTRVEPIFLERRSADHARCYACHVKSKHRRGFRLEMLSPGSSFWTEEQSRRNFQVVSQLVVPGAPLSGLFPSLPLAPEAGGGAFHGGGRQFASQDDPDWQTLARWVRGEKASGSSGPSDR